jgi:hypothetical protein
MADDIEKDKRQASGDNMVSQSWLVHTALAKVSAFRFVIAAAATVTLASLAFGGGLGAPVKIILGVALLAFGAIFMIFQAATKNRKLPRYMKLIVAFVFWAVALAFAVLIIFLLVWTGLALFSGGSTDKRTAEEIRIDNAIDDITAYRPNWENAVNGNVEPTLAELATRPAQIGDGIADLPLAKMSTRYAVMRDRYVAYGNLISCSASILINSASLEKCKKGISASKLVLERLGEMERNRGQSDISREVWEDLQNIHTPARQLRDQATLNALAYQITAQPPYLNDACAALQKMAEVDAEYDAREPPESSPILKKILPLENHRCKQEA